MILDQLIMVASIIFMVVFPVCLIYYFADSRNKKVFVSLIVTASTSFFFDVAFLIAKLLG